MSDAYGKGTVPGQVKNTNVCAYNKCHDVASAEAAYTSLTTFFNGRAYANIVQLLNGKECPQERAYCAEVDTRHNRYRKGALHDVAVLSGHRPQHESV